MNDIKKAKKYKDWFEAAQDPDIVTEWVAAETGDATFAEWVESMGYIGEAAERAAKEVAKQTALDKLRSFLDANEPEMVYFLTNTWNAQGKAITYKELREALINGDIDQSLLYQWNEDYAKFVTEHLQPAWENAINTAAAEISAKYPEWNFDPMAEGVKKWTESRAAEFVTNSTATQIAGLRAVVRRAAVLEISSVDQLSRAIRPMVGLYEQQAVANLNYYTNLINSGVSEKRALDLSIRYSARQHRYRAYNIARTELAFAYNQGSYEGTKQAQAAGYMGEVVKIWCTADDERVCEECGGLDGKTIAIDEDFNFNTKLTAPTIKRVPPAHPSCRCTVMYEEISPPLLKPTQAPANKLPDAASEADDGPKAAIPDQYQLPSSLKYKGKAHLGGTGEMHTYTDADGNEWLFKPGQTKGGATAPYRVYIQEAGYKVQSIVDPDTAVPIARYTDDMGRLGAMQAKVEAAGDIQDTLHGLYYGHDVSANIKSQLQRECVTDWLLANYDCHNRNFVTNAAGQLIGLDKEQSFRYLAESAAKKMSYTYAPNSVLYGESEPIYNALFKQFAKGEIDLDLNDVLPFIKRVESIPNKAYREIFREYAESLNGKGKAAEALLDDIVERKSNLRETFREFFEEILQERTGKKTAFKFADEGVQAAKATLSATTMTKEAAMKMTSAELKKIAKDKGIPNFGNMTKSQLATCLSDPTQIEEMNNQVKAKLAAQAAKRAERAAGATATPTTPAPKKTGKYTIRNGVYNASEVFDDFSVVPTGKVNGISVATDSTYVEGQALSIRRIQMYGEDYYEISGKLTETAMDDLTRNMSDMYASRISYGKGRQINGVVDFEPASELVSTKGYTFSTDYATLDLITSKDERALMGTFRIRVLDTEDTIIDAINAKEILHQHGLGYILDTPTAADEELMKKARLLYQVDPGKAVFYNDEYDKVRGMVALEDLVKDTAKMVMKEVYPGYYTYVNEGIHKEYQKEGLEYIWSGVRTSDSIVAMVKGGGHASTLTRINTGFMGNGASMMDDIESGGADNVFTRIATKGAYNNKATYRYSFGCGRYQVLIDPSVTDRTDWYAFHDDSYGTTRGSTYKNRPAAMQFVKEENQRYQSDNELMFRHGIDIKDWIGIDCRYESDKDELLQALRDEGITQINGVNIERFIRVNNIVGKPWK